jgi:hypothetical protein
VAQEFAPLTDDDKFFAELPEGMEPTVEMEEDDLNDDIP